MLSGKIALVTGAGSGIGLGIAREMAERGAFVLLAARSQKVVGAAEKICEGGGRAMPLQLDVTDAENVKAAVGVVLERFHRIDILVNNAGVARLSRFTEASEELRDLHIDTNLKGTWNVTKAVLPSMLKNKWGRVINISSVTGPYVSDPGYTAYAMTKAGLIGFTKSLAVEVAGDHVTVNTICPGFILTPNVKRSAAETNPESPQSVLDGMAVRVPLGRLGSPRDVGKLAAFLADDDSSYITGTDFIIDGGNMLPETNIMGLKCGLIPEISAGAGPRSNDAAETEQEYV